MRLDAPYELRSIFNRISVWELADTSEGIVNIKARGIIHGKRVRMRIQVACPTRERDFETPVTAGAELKRQEGGQEGKKLEKSRARRDRGPEYEIDKRRLLSKSRRKHRRGWERPVIKEGREIKELVEEGRAGEA